MPDALLIRYSIVFLFVGLLLYWARRNRGRLRHQSLGSLGVMTAPVSQTTQPASDIVSVAGSLLSLNQALEQSVSSESAPAPADAPKKPE